MMKEVFSKYLLLALLLVITGCAQKYDGHYKIGSPYEVKEKCYEPEPVEEHSEIGEASWYGPGFHGKKTANGVIYNQKDMTAAHRTLPLPSKVRVTNLANGNSVIVTVNDRGPFHKNRVIDVSEEAAKQLDFKLKGTAKVKVEYLPQETESYLDELGIKGQKVTAVAKHDRRKFNKLIDKVLDEKPVIKAEVKEPKNLAKHGPHQKYFVHIASFKTKQSAVDSSKQYAKLGKVKVEQNKGLYAVRLGPIASSKEAENLQKKLHSMGKKHAFVLAKKV